MDKFEDKVTLAQIEYDYKEAIDVFPALHKYKATHNALNLKKLCVEVVEFCKAILASTENEAERDIYFSMLDKLQRK
jgi:hypothetical protein